MSRFWTSRIGRGIKIYALLAVVMSILSVSASDVLVTDASAEPCVNSGSENPYPPGCTPVPEIPTVMIPLFLLVSAGSFYMIRRRSLRVSIK